MITFAFVLAVAAAEPVPTDVRSCFDHHGTAQREKRERALRAAIDCYDRVFKEQPSLHKEGGINLHYVYGEVLWDARRFEDAANAFRKGYALDANAPQAWDSAYNELLARLEVEKRARTASEKAATAKAVLVTLRAVLAHIDEGVLTGRDGEVETLRRMLSAREGSR